MLHVKPDRNPQKQLTRWTTMKRNRMLAALTALLLCAALFGCGARSASRDTVSEIFPSVGAAKNEAHYDEVYGWAPEMPAEDKEMLAASGSSIPGSAKIIRTANLEMQTLDFDTADAGLTALVEGLGGYFESRSVSNPSSSYRYASYTVRVPAAQFDAFCRQAGELCHVTYETSDAHDISETYYDTESRLKTAQIKLERLQELLSKAEKLEDIITIESAISETEWTIESLSGTLRGYDALVDYATVTISLSEVYRLSGTEEAPQTFGDRLSNAFRGGIENAGEALEDFTLWLAWNWMGLLLFALLAALAVLAARRAVRRVRRRKAAPPASADESGEKR